MDPLCKLQFLGYEPGEFVIKTNIGFDEAIKTIEDFPWEGQRHGLVIGLTAPSVSFEYGVNNIIKIAHYYNRKFILYFFNGKNVFSGIFTEKTQLYPFVKTFFEKQTIDISTLKKQRFLFKKASKDFVTDEFIYSIEGKNIFRIFNFDVWFVTGIIIMFSAIILFPFRHHTSVKIAVFVIIIILLLCSTTIILFITYYLRARNKTLQLAKNSDNFLWGKTGQEKTYRKSDIENVVTEKNNNGRSLWSYFSVATINFKNGENIQIPSLILSADKVAGKITNVTVIRKSVFVPFLKTTATKNNS